MRPVLTFLTFALMTATIVVTHPTAYADTATADSLPILAPALALDGLDTAHGLRDDILVFNGVERGLGDVEYQIVPMARGDDSVGYRVYLGSQAGPDRPFMVMRERRAAGADRTWQVVLGDSTVPLFTIKQKELGRDLVAHVAHGRTALAGRALYTVRESERGPKQVFHGQGRGELAYELRHQAGDARLCGGGLTCDDRIFTVRGADLDARPGLLPLLAVLAESEL